MRAIMMADVVRTLGELMRLEAEQRELLEARLEAELLMNAGFDDDEKLEQYLALAYERLQRLLAEEDTSEK